MSGVDVLPRWLHKAEALFRVRDLKESPPAMEYDFVCPCGKKFKRKTVYQRHIDVAHSSTESYKCKKCGKTFGNQNQLTMHMSVHDINQVLEPNKYTEELEKSPRKQKTLLKDNVNEISTDKSDSEKSLSDCEETNNNKVLFSSQSSHKENKSKGNKSPEVVPPLRRSSRQHKRTARALSWEEANNRKESDSIKMKSVKSLGLEQQDTSFNGKNECPGTTDDCLAMLNEEKEEMVDREAIENSPTSDGGDDCEDLNNIQHSMTQLQQVPMTFIDHTSMTKVETLDSNENVMPKFNAQQVEQIAMVMSSQEKPPQSQSLSSLVGVALQQPISQQIVVDDSSLEELRPLLDSNIRIKIENIDDDHQYGQSEDLIPNGHMRQNTQVWRSLIPGQGVVPLPGDDYALERRPKKITKVELPDPEGLVKMEAMEYTDMESKANVTGAEQSQLAVRRLKESGYVAKRTARDNAGANFECYICGKKFGSEKYLSMHVSLHGSMKSSGDYSSYDNEKVVNVSESVTSVTAAPPPAVAPVTMQVSYDAVPVEPEPEKKPQPVVTKNQSINKDSNGWTCQICNKFFHHTSGYKNHMRTHSDERPFVCQICDIGFKEKYHLKKHNLFIHSTELPEKCRYCGKRFKDSTAVRAHERIHSDLRPFSCRRCDKAFKTSECLWHHEHRSKSCGASGANGTLPSLRGQTRRRKFKNNPQPPGPTVQPIVPNGFHQKMETIPEPKQETLPLINVTKQLFPVEPEPVKSEQIKMEFEDDDLNWTENEESDPDSVLSGSDMPGSITTNSNGIQVAEVKPMQQRKEYTCKICKKTFNDISLYGKHARMHLEERPFVCSICDIGFKMKVHLKKHNLYVHSDEYPCACSFCGKRFKDSSAVKLHERIHSTDRPFECDACGKTFKTNENLWGHQHRGKCHAMLAKMAQQNGYIADEPTAQASVRSKDTSGPNVNATAASNQVTAQASFGNNQVTARAMLLNNKLTAHASITGQDICARASIDNGNVTAQANVGDSVADSRGELPTTEGQTYLIKNTNPENVVTCVSIPQGAAASSPTITALVTMSAQSQPAQAGQSRTAKQNPLIASALLKPPSCPPGVELPQFTQAQLLSSPIRSQGEQKLPTLKEFLARGVAGSKSPAWQLGHSSCPPPKSPTPGANGGIVLNGDITPYKSRSAHPPTSIALTPPASRKSPAFHSGSPFMGRASPCSDISPFGPGAAFLGTGTGMNEMLLGHDDPHHLWEDDDNSRTLSSDWQSDSESLFGISDQVMTQL